MGTYFSSPSKVATETNDVSGAIIVGQPVVVEEVKEVVEEVKEVVKPTTSKKSKQKKHKNH